VEVSLKNADDRTARVLESIGDRTFVDAFLREKKKLYVNLEDCLLMLTNKDLGVDLQDSGGRTSCGVEGYRCQL
jgi:hypothetical protein